jgi:threonine synthase
VKYVSTRGAAPVLEFDDVLLTGLGRDGGLYVPESWPRIGPDRLAAMAGRPYAEVATEVMAPFVGSRVDETDLAAMAADAYATFDHSAVTPLKQLDAGLWLLELFHGPTLAFKDVALQLVGRLFDHELSRRGDRVTIVGATSGDTGSAAIEACRDRDAIDIFILHPKGRISEVQRRLMTTVPSANVHNVAVDGTFDDCQDLVKAMFADEAFRDRMALSAVNSINWARIMAQSVYYVVAAAALGAGPSRPLAFTVPTGNFGNVFSAYVARWMGVPISQLVIASNENDILTRFLDTGRMEMTGVHATLSPAMDIQVSSNAERLLFELYGRDGAAIADAMTRFRAEGVLDVGAERLASLRELFDGMRVDDASTTATIADVHAATGELIDPHTAVGVTAARACGRDPRVPMITLATAHPAKFPDAVAGATGIHPPLPDRLADLFERPERVEDLPNDLEAVQAHVAALARR